MLSLFFIFDETKNVRTQGRRYIRLMAEPGSKSGTGLMQQHSKPVNNTIVSCVSASKKGCPQRSVDYIGNNGGLWQKVEVQIQWWLVCIPRVVVLVSKEIPSSASDRSDQGKDITGDPNSVARLFARSLVRLMILISGAPASCNPTHIARAAPPAPIKTTGPVSARQCGAPSYTACRKP